MKFPSHARIILSMIFTLLCISSISFCNQQPLSADQVKMRHRMVKSGTIVGITIGAVLGAIIESQTTTETEKPSIKIFNMATGGLLGGVFGGVMGLAVGLMIAAFRLEESTEAEAETTKEKIKILP